MMTFGNLEQVFTALSDHYEDPIPTYKPFYMAYMMPSIARKFLGVFVRLFMGKRSYTNMNLACKRYTKFEIDDFLRERRIIENKF